VKSGPTHNVYADLVGAHVFSTIAKTNPDGTQGNVVFPHLFLEALHFQPGNPTYKRLSSLLTLYFANHPSVVTARDTWIQADQNRYGGANKCLLWKAFASRGLGVQCEELH